MAKGRSALNEPRIFKSKPKWVGLEEVERKNGLVWFKTKYGKMAVPEKYVDQQSDLD